MSDFLVAFGFAHEPAALLEFLRMPYAGYVRAGKSWKYTWGVAALLEDPVGKFRNIIEHEGCAGGWVGDAPSGPVAVREMLPLWVQGQVLWKDGQEAAMRSAQCKAARLIDGASAVMICGQRFVGIFTDPMSAVQVYAAYTDDDQVVALGTHADIVAQVANFSESIDYVSVAEFVDKGTPTCPHTMYKNVKELDPGHVFVAESHLDGKVRLVRAAYWTPAPEEKDDRRMAELVGEFCNCWLKAVQARCEGDMVGVQLSGGLDSRLVMAAVPASKRCVGLTYCDTINREARIARMVACAYDREWRPLQRDSEYVGRTAIDSIRFTGCEGEWHHAHGIGFVREIQEIGIDELFTGLFMDNNFKAYYARDLVAVRRFKGLLPPIYRRVSLDYAKHFSDFSRANLGEAMLECVVERRRRFHENHFARGRESEWEWLDGYPLTQSSDNTAWIVERRLLPVRLPVNDRRLVDLAFRVPAGWKVSRQFFERGAVRLLGAGCRIPNANDGVRPGSTQFSRLIQRAIRKAENKWRDALLCAGLHIPVPHSWHDYERYWRESPVLRELRIKHCKSLLRFHGTVFRCDPEALLLKNGLSWKVGSRLLQLGIWLSIVEEYCRSCSSRSYRFLELSPVVTKAKSQC